ncbi:class I SAM-dependent methyltransferase [Chamaesiphon sp.]|uniref:class I SAM-dependent methyltransferase n=1 Tax=Chamaesiphon sp. TaxID=2814140 RepID=UPI00359418DA
MLSSNTNKDLYNNGIEFQTWLDLQTLFPPETYLIQKYLQPDLKTVEAGTNGGRILLKMQEMGFTNLAGFDYIPELIDCAIERDPQRRIDFQVGDAISLSYPDNSFEQIIYLQQIICLIETESDRFKAIQEAYRILATGGTGIFSFLSFDARIAKPIYASYLAYLRTLRKLRGNDVSIQNLPWLKLGGKLNPNSIVDRPPYIYWYRASEICQLLQSVGFEIVAIGTDAQTSSDSMKTTDRELLTAQLEGMLYVVVKK